MVRGCPLAVHYWVDLQSVHRFRCYDIITPNEKLVKHSRSLVMDIDHSFGVVSAQVLGCTVTMKRCVLCQWTKSAERRRTSWSTSDHKHSCKHSR